LRKDKVVWQRLPDKCVCGATEGWGKCVVVVGNGKVVPPMPAPTLCNRVVIVGAGASFVEGFVKVAEAELSAGTWGGGSCGTTAVS